LKVTIDKKYQEHLDSTPEDGRVARIAFMTKLIKELYNAENDDVKDEVEEYRGKHVGSGAIKLEDGSDDEPVDKDTQQSMNEQMQQ
jgi:hypothetical protein